MESSCGIRRKAIKKPHVRAALPYAAKSATHVCQSKSPAITPYGNVTTVNGKETPKMLSKKAIQILTDRGLDEEILARFGVSSFKKNGSEWVKIPYVRDGKAVNHKHRTIEGEKQMHQDSGGEKIFWNFDILHDSNLSGQPLVITEGELDSMAAIQCGFTRTVSVPDGAPAKALVDTDTDKYNYLHNALPLLRDCTEIIIAADGDEAGKNLLHDLSLRLGRQRCKWLKYPEGCKDLNDVLKKYGADGVKETLQNAHWCKVNGVYRMDSLPPAPESPAFSTGFPVMDDHYKVRLGDFVVVTGIPSHGKSTFVNDLCCRLIERYGWTAAFASFEQHPAIDHKRNLIKWRTGKHPATLTAQEQKTSTAWINNHFVFIMPDEDEDVSLEWVLEKASTAVIRHNAKIVVIDPWNEMDHNFPSEISLTQYTGFAIKQFRKFARKHNIHLIIVAHPTKLKKTAMANSIYLTATIFPTVHTGITKRM